MCEPGDAFFKRSPGMAHKFEAAAEATSVADLFERLERRGQMLHRSDPSWVLKMAGDLEPNLPCLQSRSRLKDARAEVARAEGGMVVVFSFRCASSSRAHSGYRSLNFESGSGQTDW
jgi:hypothetical protein